jgi:hypothetical protein
MEVELPEGPYKGPWNHELLRKAVEGYVRDYLPEWSGPKGASAMASGIARTAERRVEIELPEE